MARCYVAGLDTPETGEFSSPMVARRPSLLVPRFCRECGGSLKRNGPFGYRCTSCGTIRVVEQPRDFVLRRPAQVAEARDDTPSDSVVMHRKDRWARTRRGIVSVGDAAIGLARNFAVVGQSLAKEGGAAAQI